MKINLLAYLKDHRIHIDGNILTYMICVVIAAILWFLNALNKDYTSEISYPVKYTDFPQGKYLVSSLPETITLEVKAKGFALLGYRISTSFLPMTLDVNAYSNHSLEKNNVLEYTLRLNDIKDKLNNQLSSDIKLLDIKPREINFKFSHAESRKIPVVPVVAYDLKKQYILKDKIDTDPDSILVSGPALIIDTLKYIPTERWEAGEIGKDISRNIRLDIPSNLTAEEKEVKVNIHLERFTEARRTIPIRIDGLPDSLTIRLFPASVEVTYEIGLSMYDRIKDKDFDFAVDFQKGTTSDFLTVKAKKIPSFIKNLTFTPRKVEYILEKNK